MLTTTKIILITLAVTNLLAFVLMGVDKAKAKNHAWRIKETTLFLFPVLGGAVGGCLGMWAFRHKTKHWYFVVGFHALAVLQLAAAAYFGLLK